MTIVLLLVCGALLISSGGLLWWSSRGGPADSGRIAQRRLQEILRVEADIDKDQTSSIAKLLRRVGGSPADGGGRFSEWRRELRGLLTQAGWHDRDARTLIKGALFLAPFSAGLVAVALVAGSRWSGAQGLALIFVGIGAGVLVPRQLLRYQASRRRAAIVEEVPIMVRMISLLFEAGLSMEVALKTLRDSGAGVLPNLSIEIGRMLARIESGLDRVEALEFMARELDIQELSDAVAVLAHTAVAGGSVRQSLSRLAEVIEDRNRTGLRERIGRLSAKMTVVMVVFLFPALFIFLAGPGLVAIAGALGGIK